MASGLHLWSKTAGNNSNADTSINFAEGQAPASVNDSCRAVMARIAEWRDDLGGITTGGSSTAYTLASNRTFASLSVMDKAIICFVPHATNGDSPTLNVDGLGAKQIRSATGLNVSAASLILGTPYQAIYINASTEFILINSNEQFSVPVGAMLPYIGTAAPNSNFVLPFGQAVSRTTYAVLFAKCSTSFGVGDNSTTFNLPDLRGRVPFGADNMGGSTAGRVTNAGSGIVGTTLGAAGGAETVTLIRTNLPNVSIDTDMNSNAVTVSDTRTWNADKAASTAGVLGSSDAIQKPNGTNSTLALPVSVGSGSISASIANTTGFTNFLSGGAASQVATNKMPPAQIVNYILRIL